MHEIVQYFDLVVYLLFGALSLSLSLLPIYKKLESHLGAVWLSGLSAGLQSKGSLVRFPVKAHAWVTGQVPGVESAIGNHTLFISLFFILPSPLFKIDK